jgi:hypothetical protein
MEGQQIKAAPKSGTSGAPGLEFWDTLGTRPWGRAWETFGFNTQDRLDIAPPKPVQDCEKGRLSCLLSNKNKALVSAIVDHRPYRNDRSRANSHRDFWTPLDSYTEKITTRKLTTQCCSAYASADQFTVILRIVPGQRDRVR